MSGVVGVFKNKEFGEIRTTIINDAPWFVGKDVAGALGYKNTTDAFNKHVDEEDKIMGSQNATPSITDSMGRVQHPTWINESGLYSLILSSKLPSAKRFKRWVTSEVLPALRKTGGYVDDPGLFVDTYFPNATPDQKVLIKASFDNILVLQKQVASLNEENDLLAKKNLEWADRPLINALVRKYAACTGSGGFGKAWNEFKKELLYLHGINLNSRITKWRDEGKGKPKTLDMLADEELPDALATIVSMCRENGIDVEGLLGNRAS